MPPRRTSRRPIRRCTRQRSTNCGVLKPTVRMLVQHSSQEHRDAHINSGMEEGMQESLAYLEEVARSLR